MSPETDTPWSMSVNQAWALLIVAGLLETIWAVGLKTTSGFSKLGPTIVVSAVAWVSFALLGLAMKHLPAGTAYAVWVGVGAAGAVLAGIVFLGESANPMRLACVGLILLGVVGLKLVP